jgi:hypothetical protein
VLTRSFQVLDGFTRGDGRTLDMLCVPFNTPTMVSDGGPAYREAFDPAAFTRQFAANGAAGRVDLRWHHRDSVTDVIGTGLTFDARPDHLRGSFRVAQSTVGDHVLALLADRPNYGVSIGFRARRSETVDGVVWRRDADLIETSLVPVPAYPGAQLIAVRGGHIEVIDPGPTDQRRALWLDVVDTFMLRRVVDMDGVEAAVALLRDAADKISGGVFNPPDAPAPREAPPLTTDPEIAALIKKLADDDDQAA